jgi:hypothetical protein
VAYEGHVHVFRLSASQGDSQAQTAARNVPCSAIRIPDGDNISFGRHSYRQPDGSVCLDVEANAVVYTLRIAADYTDINRTLAWADAAFNDRDTAEIYCEVVIGAQRIALVSKNILSTKRPVNDLVPEDAGDLSDHEERSFSQAVQLILTTRAVVARDETERRLGTPMRRDFAMPLRAAYANIYRGIASYDEWRGMGCVTLYNEMDDLLGVAVFKV